MGIYHIWNYLYKLMNQSWAKTLRYGPSGYIQNRIPDRLQF